MHLQRQSQIIEQIKDVASKTLAEEELAIFDAHLMMIGDQNSVLPLKTKLHQIQ